MSLASGRRSSRRSSAVVSSALALALLAGPSFVRADEAASDPARDASDASNAPDEAEVEPMAAPAAPSGVTLEEIGYKAIDVFPIRFGGLLRLVTGSVLLVPASLFSTLSLPFNRDPGVYLENYELLVQEPFDYTFRRGLGEELAGL